MRIGIFGGAFDPIHLEHKKIIQNSFTELALDKIILLPSYDPPHKSNKFSPFNIRVKMLEVDTSELDYIIIDQREFNNNNQTNCAYKVLTQLAKEYSNDELIYIIGGDSINKFHTWVHPEIIAKLMPIAVVARQGYNGVDTAINNVRSSYGADIRLLSFRGEEVSSSAIRATYEFRENSDYVSGDVDKIITKEKLYNQFEPIIDKLKSSISNTLFEHCKSTVFYALKLADNLNLNYEEVFLSALLHDCAKEMQVNDKYGDIPQKIVHQFYGAEIAGKEYGIKNTNILDAIQFHTTGKKNMTTLGKLIFCADMLESNRVYQGVTRLREIIEKDFDSGFKACVQASISRVKTAQRELYYLTKECYDYYFN